MNPMDSGNGIWFPTTKQDKEEVRQQMNRLLDTSHFKNSKRYPLLFRFIVEETLDGRGELLKERLLGVRVFDRPADYDTAEDPIVRVTIAEIRKRIAQYYHEEAHESEMRIELMPGRYVPEFRRRNGNGHHGLEAGASATNELTAESASTPPHAADQPVLQSESKTGLSHRARYFVCATAMLLLALGAGLYWNWVYPSALDELWGPLLANRRTVIFCLPVGLNSGAEIASAAGILVRDTASTQEQIVSQDVPFHEAPPISTFLAHEILGENVVFSDTLAALRISNYFAAHNCESTFRRNMGTTLDDLRKGPIVLIGGLDNQWTLRALASLRYRFAGTESEQYWITDTKAPGMKDWGLDLKVPLSDVKRDFAIIARVHDDSTGQVEMIVAGIGMSGTAAAGEFLVDLKQVERLRSRIGPGFRDHDFEAVLSTDVVNGIAGTPSILAVAVR